ncbi:solute carrier family 22 member 5-like isoform X2 [Cyclopterus lumpus]|uniref:solute carrier family 22 member 5-like isoform X2 n=1 Tax=Cyclopterus lumpus TaxID=8103 RepID=UPI0014863A1C|nr:solute carrier family 22 member 5-like isoform X2 [Cyclopterus lumpus]
MITHAGRLRSSEEPRTPVMSDYPDSVAFLGQWGRFQQVVFFLLCASIVPNGFGAFNLVFLTDAPGHRCSVPDVGLTEDWRAAIIPVQVVNGNQQLSRCSRFRLDVVRNLSAQGLVPGRDVNLTDLEQEGCVDGWSYSRDVYQSTIVSEFDLVCSEQWKLTFISTVFFVGVLLGSFFSGQLSDRFGRKPVLFLTMGVQMVFTFIQVFSTSWIMFTVLLFINGLGQISNFVAALVLGTEILTGHVRVLYSSMGACLSFTLGYMMLPGCAYLLRDWTSLLLALSLPCLAYLPLWWFIPESPRWLLSQGRVEEAESIVRKAAKWNKVQAPLVIFQDYTVNNKTDLKENPNAFDLLRTSSIRITTLLLCLVTFATCTGYYGLSFNTSQLHADPYMSCFISAAVEVPAYISGWLVLRYFPRRRSICCSLLLQAVSLFLIQLVPQTLPYLSIALEMLAKYFVTITFSMMFAYIAELYPTLLRNTAVGVCSTVGRLGNCIAPFLITLRTLGCVAALAALYIPESFGQPLPETIQQMHKRERMKCPCITGKETPIPVVFLDSTVII